MNVFVDTSVWIDLFADRDTLQIRALREITARADRLLVGDLVLTEVLQGTRDRRDFERKRARLVLFDRLAVVSEPVAIQAARNYQTLRALGITIRKTIDTLIATRCIIDDIPLLYSDRDFDPFVEHLGLRSAMT
ncbi:PIN domain-containing protein [Sphingomonas sp. NPDC079357]|uniref:type II toxin-antitoxin system VapC family toxin n=1 Tax=Sphingomonas sp. NPDC079357 TaxID=3364518 RepID=UPI00384ABBDF